MIAWLTDPFTLEFMQRALVASLIVGVVCSVIGCFVVLRAMAFLGDALAHAILPGVAIAYLLGANLLVGALVAALVVAVGIGLFSRRGGVKEDTAIGILFAAALALGVVLISTVRSYATDLTHILFGNVLGVSASPRKAMARSTTKQPITEHTTPTMSEATRARCMNSSVNGSVSQAIIAARRAAHGCGGDPRRRPRDRGSTGRSRPCPRGRGLDRRTP